MTEKLRDDGDRRFSEMLSEGIPDDKPVLFCKDEGSYVEASFFPTRRDFVEGSNRHQIGGLSRRQAASAAKKLKAAIVNF